MAQLYIVKCNDYYKIGVAQDATQRIEQFKTGNPYELEVLAIYDFANAGEVEFSLHHRFSNKRKNGEWFALSAGDLLMALHLCDKLGYATEKPHATMDNLIPFDEEVEFDEMIANGWRIEITARGAAWQWRRGSVLNRQVKYGGRIETCPAWRLEEYERNKQRRGT